MFVTICHFNKNFSLGTPKERGYRRSLGLFYCLILFGIETIAHLTRYGGETQVIRGEVHTHCAGGQPAQVRYRYKEIKYRSGTKDGEKVTR
jgi:hypothetical protein